MKMDAVYRATSAACRLALKKFNVYSDLEVREIAAYRRAIICCGRYALKLSKGIRESVELQEMLNYSAGESSDAYVFDKFNS